MNKKNADGENTREMEQGATELKTQARHEKKMEAIGRLAGALAHDLNNILTGIVGYGQLLRMKTREGDQLRGYAENILSLSDRAGNLIEALLAVGGKSEVSLKAVHIDDMVGGACRVFAGVDGAALDLRIIPAGKDLRVMADPRQIERALVHILVNARDAMPEGGRLTVRTDVATVERTVVRHRARPKPGRFAVVSITDTGVGMDGTARERIFDPFYTTKEVGKGTGLGLSIVYGIIAQHNGYIDVDSKPGKGTTFRIYLPLIGAD